MPIFLANPAGFWALLGIPAILFIHFLQRQSQQLPSSTLFLLDAIDRRSLRGRKIDRLRNSIPLWLQLLCVLLLTWLLVEPRWKSDTAVQRVVLVLDSSASMEAFREEALASINREIPRLTARSGGASYTVLESHLQGEKLYRGDSISDLLDSLDAWIPSNSSHSPESALRVGRSLAGTGGTLVYLTDHVVDDLPYGATLLAIGETIDNVGFAGQAVRTDGEGGETGVTWQATVRNYSDSPQTREWFLAADQQRTGARTLTLEPGATRILSGKFPEGASRVSLVLEPDRFARDDRLHLVVPRPKPLYVAHNVSANVGELIDGVLSSIENTPLYRDDAPGAGSAPDLVFSTYNPLQPRPFPEVGVVFLNQENVPREFFRGPIVIANHHLVANLNWQGLISKRTAGIPAAENDVPLLWQGDRPLIVLRQEGATRQLLFNFDVAQSNAARLPAFIVLVDRFAHQLRREKIAMRSENTELRQPIPLAFDTSEGAAELLLESPGRQESFALSRAALIRAPGDPGFFRIRQGEALLFEGSANFADTREADFSSAAARSDLASVPREIVERQTISDPLWQAWAIALLLVALLTWLLLNRPDEVPAEA